jgi:hypothetical protein
VQDALRAFQGQNNIQTTGMLTPRTRRRSIAGVRQQQPAAASPRLPARTRSG